MSVVPHISPNRCWLGAMTSQTAFPQNRSPPSVVLNRHDGAAMTVAIRAGRPQQIPDFPVPR